jgi:hypothetical protein
MLVQPNIAISHHSLYACVYYTIRHAAHPFSNFPAPATLGKVPRHFDGDELP